MKSITIQWGQENEQRVGRHEERRSNHGCGQPARTRKKERKIGKMKKGIAMLLTLALLLTVLPAALAEDNAPDLKGTTIRILSEDCFSSDASWANILPLYAKVEADTGVKLDWEIITSDYTNIMLTRLAGSADGSPDIVQLNTDAGTWAKLIEDGVLVNIKELMDENAPHLAQFFREKRPDIMGSMTYVDGGIYTIPDAAYETVEDFYGKLATSGDNILMYRADLAEKLNIEEPKTIEDLHKMLLAFKAYDASIIPLHIWNYTSWQSIRVFANCYGLKWANPNTGSNFFRANDDGTVEFTAITDEAKAWVKEMATWVSEDLVSTTVNAEDKMGLPGTGKVGVCYVGNYGTMQELNKLLEDNGVEGAYFKALPWLTGPNGEKGIGTRVSFENAIGIVDNGDTEQIKKVLQYIDYTYFTDEGIVSQALGVQGVNWDYDADGQPRLNDETIQAWYVDKTSSLQKMGGNGHCRMPQVYRQSLREYMDQVAIEAGAKKAKTDEELKVCQDWADAAFLSYPFMYYTAEEQAVIDDIFGDLGTYVNEMINRFVLGELDIDENWDEFVSNVKAMNIDTVVAAYQSAYDRYLGK